MTFSCWALEWFFHWPAAGNFFSGCCGVPAKHSWLPFQLHLGSALTLLSSSHFRSLTQQNYGPKWSYCHSLPFLKVLFLSSLLLLFTILDILSGRIGLFMPTEQIDLAGSLAIIDRVQTVIEFCLLSTWKKPTPCCLFCALNYVTIFIACSPIHFSRYETLQVTWKGRGQRRKRLRTQLVCDCTKWLSAVRLTNGGGSLSHILSQENTPYFGFSWAFFAYFTSLTPQFSGQ